MGLFNKQHKAKPSRSGIPSDHYTDPRDGNTYRTIQIGTEVWMAENLAFKADWPGCRAYKDDQGNVSTYGYLYDWETANRVSPPGWHLPSLDEWNLLIDGLGGEEVAGPKMMSPRGWPNWPDASRTGESGFEALPGGCFGNMRSFEMLGNLGYWWSSTKDISGSYWKLSLWPTDNKVRWSSVSENNLFMCCSVRCLRNQGLINKESDSGSSPRHSGEVSKQLSRRGLR